MKGTLKLEERDPETVLHIEWLKQNVPYFYKHGRLKSKGRSDNQRAKELEERKKSWLRKGWSWDDEEKKKYKPCPGCDDGRMYNSRYSKCDSCVTSI